MGEHISLTVNGAQRELDVEPRRLLHQLLREDLDLTGTHVGCDTSQCGACTVHVDGRAVKSCTMLAVQADGASVTTIEGMAVSAETLHPLQTAFWEKHDHPELARLHFQHFAGKDRGLAHHGLDPLVVEQETQQEQSQHAIAANAADGASNLV